MCGICGIISNSSTQLQALPIMQQAIVHRGPDDRGHWRNEHVAFGHLRLSIIDLSAAGHQPMIDPASGCVVIFNGEIYNYLELKHELKSKYSFVTHSDTEVLLAAYISWGISFLKKLRGMFALALYDPRTQEIVLARDRVGIKPLYYRQQAGSFFFASEIKALVGGELGAPVVNKRKAAEFLVARQLDTDHETMFDGVRQLRPAHWMRVNAEGKVLNDQPYWELPENGTKVFGKADEAALVDQMDQSMQLHLRSDVPVGCFVSGGLDSSTIACFALRQSPQGTPMHTYSAILPGGNAENDLIPHITSLPRVAPHTFSLDGESFFDDLPAVIHHHDEPLLDGSMYSHFKLCELAHQNGMKVLLSGAGGDELFGGYLSHVSSYLGHLLQRAKLRQFFNTIGQVSSQSEYKYAHLVRKGIQQALPPGVVATMKNHTFKRQFRHVNLDFSIPHFYHLTNDAWRTNLLNNYLSWTVPPYLHYEDRNSMAFGVEIRVPFYDHVLMEWVMQFDPASLIKGRSKALMRDSFRGIVPDAILDQRGKYGFPSPIDNLLKQSEQSRQLYFDLVPRNPFFHRAEAEKLGDRFFRGQADLGAFWRALSFAMWHQQFFHA